MDVKKTYECPVMEVFRLGEDIITQSSTLSNDYDDTRKWKWSK